MLLNRKLLHRAKDNATKVVGSEGFKAFKADAQMVGAALADAGVKAYQALPTAKVALNSLEAGVKNVITMPFNTIRYMGHNYPACTALVSFGAALHCLDNLKNLNKKYSYDERSKYEVLNTLGFGSAMIFGSACFLHALSK